MTHAIREHNSSILDRHAVEHHFRWAAVEIVAGSLLRPSRRFPFFRRFLRCEVANVRHIESLLKKVLAASQILMPSLRLFPPRLCALVMQSPGSHGHAGRSIRIRPGLMGITVQDESINALAKGPITENLDRKRMRYPLFSIRRRESLRAYNRFAVHVRS